MTSRPQGTSSFLPTKRPLVLFVWLLYCALTTLQFIRFYSVSARFYLSMPAYLAGHERLPFQERVLPIFLLKPLFASRWVMHFAHNDGPFTPERGPFYLVSLFAFLLAAFFVQKLYAAVSHRGTLGLLVYPIFLFAAMWSYVIHNEANFSFPYDLLSVAFFAAGFYFIYTRQFLPLLLVMALGTLNRETTLFLVGVYILDAASTGTESPVTLRDRFSLAQVPWVRAALLGLVWLAIKLAVARHYAANDPSENYVRFFENFGRLKPRLWPALLNVCGYLLPIVLLLRRRIEPTRFGNYLYILPFWFAVMFYTGVIVETRIYGELCSFVAVASVLILEQYLSTLPTAAVADTTPPLGAEAPRRQTAA